MAKRLRAYFDTVTRNGSIRGTRFRNGDRPNRNTFFDLVDSIVFRSETADRAKEDDGTLALTEMNGHVVASTDVQAKANQGKLPDRTLAVQPSQLPDVDSTDQLTITGTNEFSADEPLEIEVDASVTTRNRFLVKFGDTFKTWLQTFVTWTETQVANLSTALTDLTTRVTNAETNISNNSTNIATNTSDIATNLASINTLTTNLATTNNNVGTNTTDIASLTALVNTFNDAINNLNDAIDNDIIMAPPVISTDANRRDSNNAESPYKLTNITFPNSGTYDIQVNGSITLNAIPNEREIAQPVDWSMTGYLYYRPSGASAVEIDRQNFDMIPGAPMVDWDVACGMSATLSLTVTAGTTIEFFTGCSGQTNAGTFAGDFVQPEYGGLTVLAKKRNIA
jgi:hypothetical protein